MPRGLGGKALLGVAEPAEEDGEPEHEEDVAQDRAGDRGLHHLDVAGGEGHRGDDQLGGVAEGGV